MGHVLLLLFGFVSLCLLQSVDRDQSDAQMMQMQQELADLRAELEQRNMMIRRMSPGSLPPQLPRQRTPTKPSSATGTPDRR